MIIDITLRITPKMLEDANANDKAAFIGHIGTHFDVMDKEFPLEYTERKGIVFDVSGVTEREITREDIDMTLIEPGMFVTFYTGFIEAEGYGSQKYFTEHPQLSDGLIEELVKSKISIIGVDFAGIRRNPEHVPMDQFCADNGVFVIENLYGLKAVLGSEQHAVFTANTYPVNYAEMTGLPCRVTAKV